MSSYHEIPVKKMSYLWQIQLPEQWKRKALLKHSNCYMKNSTPGSLLHDKLHFQVAQSYSEHEHDRIQYLGPTSCYGEMQIPFW